MTDLAELRRVMLAYTSRPEFQALPDEERLSQFARDFGLEVVDCPRHEDGDCHVCHGDGFVFRVGTKVQ